MAFLVMVTISGTACLGINDGNKTSLLIQEIKKKSQQQGIVLEPQVLGLKICKRERGDEKEKEKVED